MNRNYSDYPTLRKDSWSPERHLRAAGRFKDDLNIRSPRPASTDPTTTYICRSVRHILRKRPAFMIRRTLHHGGGRFGWGYGWGCETSSCWQINLSVHESPNESHRSWIVFEMAKKHTNRWIAEEFRRPRPPWIETPAGAPAKTTKRRIMKAGLFRRICGTLPQATRSQFYHFTILLLTTI